MTPAFPHCTATLLADLWSYGVAGLGPVPVPVSFLPEMAEIWGPVAKGGGESNLAPPAFHKVSAPVRQAVAGLGVVVADGRV
ncbi:MAG: hypothetical protein ACRC14_07055, partial [Paracoccaceae bacterium]